MYAALCTLFEENQELTNDLCYSCIEISFTEEDVSIVTETCAEQCLHACSATCDRDFTEVEYTAEELKGIQTLDPDLELILSYLRSNKIPTEDDIFISSQAAKNYRVNKEMFFLDTAGILRNIPKNENPSRLDVPKNLVDEVLHSCHNIPAMGHQGVVRTYLRVKEKFYWFSMSQATKNFVRTCDVCSKFKNANRKVRCPMSKMERVHLDFLGPLPESTSGNTNILVMVDQFTKCPYQAKQPK